MLLIHDIVKFHWSFISLRRIIQPRAGNKHVVVLNKWGLHSILLQLRLVATRSAWNKTSLIFRKGEGGLGILGRGWSDNVANHNVVSMEIRVWLGNQSAQYFDRKRRFWSPHTMVATEAV